MITDMESVNASGNESAGVNIANYTFKNVRRVCVAFSGIKIEGWFAVFINMALSRISEIE